MNSYDKAVALNLAGTEAENVAVLQALTVADIPVAAVRTWLREHVIWYRGADGAMKGLLASAYQGASDTHKASLDYFHATVFGDSATVLRTTDPAWSVQVYHIVQLVAALVPSIAGIVDEFYALDGGRPYKTLTVEQYAADKLESEAASALASSELAAANQRVDWQVRFDAAMNTIGTSEQAAGVADLRAIADEIEAG